MTFFYTLCIVLNCHLNEFKTTPSRSLIKSSLISFDFQKAAIATTSFFKISVNELVGNRRNKQWLEFSNLNLVFTFFNASYRVQFGHESNRLQGRFVVAIYKDKKFGAFY